MNYKVYIYVVMILLSIYTLSGINFNGLFKKDRVIESRIFVIILGIISGYLLTNFITDFLNVSKIL